MNPQEEKPSGGGSWLNNALVYERSRVKCLRLAEATDLEGKSAEAAHWRELAAEAKTQRDRAHAEGLRRQMNRSLAARRRYH